MDAERFLETLKREQAQLALASLRSPNSTTEYEFGVLCGLIQSYDRMQTILQEQLDEDKGKPRQEQRPPIRSNPYLEELDNAPTLPEQYRRR